MPDTPSDDIFKAALDAAKAIAALPKPQQGKVRPSPEDFVQALKGANQASVDERRVIATECSKVPEAPKGPEIVVEVVKPGGLTTTTTVKGQVFLIVFRHNADPSDEPDSRIQIVATSKKNALEQWKRKFSNHKVVEVREGITK